MNIKSNTLGKLEKIKNGTIFDDPMIYLKELLQNCQRSKSNNVIFKISEKGLLISDDGCGCKNPEHLLTLDLSSWKSTDEGYGIGFWSCLIVPGLTNILITSSDWKIDIDVEKIFNTGDLNVEPEKISFKKGFEVFLSSDYFYENQNKVENYIELIAKYLEFDTFINEKHITRTTIFDDYVAKNECKFFENSIFQAKLEINNHYDSGQLTVYYDKRKITSFYGVPYISGVIEIKKNKVTLKEPDRTNFVRDEKYFKFKEKIELCAKELFYTYLSENQDYEDKYMDAIVKYVNVKDFTKFLTLDLEDFDNFVKISVEVLNGSIVDKTEIIDMKDKNRFSEPDEIHKNSYSVQPEKKEKAVEKKHNFKENIKKAKNHFWVEQSRLEDYSDLIARAEYCGIKVLRAKNKLYEIALSEYDIKHISAINDCLKEVIIKKNVFIKNKKELCFINLLQPICNLYGLDYDIFKIANLEKNVSFEYENKTLYKKKWKNSKNEISIFGCASYSSIYFDRTALNLNQFKISQNKFSIHEFKALIHFIETISHELAHYLYQTQDNTKEHLEYQLQIQKEILSIYIKK